MGIRGLKRALSACPAPAETLPQDCHLLIDSSGFLFFVLTKLINNGQSARELGGDYKRLREGFIEEIQKLQGFAFFDGKDRMKEATAEKRRLDQEKRWDRLLALCRDKTEASVTNAEEQEGLPRPVLSMQELRCVLKELDIRTIQCEVEADQEMALYCAAENAGLEEGNESCFCYANDSDFYVFKSCPYIEFGSITQSKSKTAKQECQAVVWRRESIAESMEMTEQQLMEWCILIGNDFTDHFSRSDYCINGKKLDTIPRGYSPQDFIDLRDIIIEAYLSIPNYEDMSPIDGCLSSNNPELMKAIDFSRKLYELRDLSEFPYDKDSDDDKILTLNSSERNHCRRLLRNALQLVPSTENMTLPASDCTDILIKTIPVLRKYKSFKAITEEHVKAINLMQQHLTSHHRPHIDIKGRLIPDWSDVLAGHYYQLLCKEFYVITRYDRKSDSSFIEDSTAASEESENSKSMNIVAPNLLFDGFLFHMALREIRKSKKVNSKKTLIPLEFNEEEKASESKQEPLKTNKTVENKKSIVLPIDQHRESILRKIKSDRIVIIHGETGCGKSSRLPVMIYEDAIKRNQPCKMMISQPRRIAASTLMKRVRESVGKVVGLRMGHGVRDEDEDTKLFFVTTGYLVRAIAHHPEIFDSHTHLIIDEVHERSIDGDILCLLARKLLSSNRHIRIILMSATVHTDLYRKYFTEGELGLGDLEVLSVGVRRFPIATYYAEDIAQMAKDGKNFSTIKAIPPSTASQCRQLALCLNSVTGSQVEDFVPIKLIESQYILIETIIRCLVPPGTGVLVFLSGISDISEMAERLEMIPGIKLFMIHSDIPFEDQENAFEPAAKDEIKVVLATNAAESSITMSDCDVVICCGTHKAMRYSGSKHRAQLVNTWISKASATQRAGRTGRVRPGTVYRLYPKALHDKFDEHEVSEVHRVPLQEVILSMRVMFESAKGFDGVIPLLEELVEPPDMDNVMLSFTYLYEAGMITNPSDYGDLTGLGRFAGHLPCDLQLGRMVALGVAIGKPREAAILAAAIMLPKQLFRIATPLIHTDPDEYNAIVRSGFIATTEFDDGMYSDPLMMLRIFEIYTRMPPSMRLKWLRSHSIVESRMKQYISSAKDMIRRLCQALNEFQRQGSLTATSRSKDVDKGDWWLTDYEFNEDSTMPDYHLDDYDQFVLRLLLLWTCDGNIIRMKAARKKASEDDGAVLIESPEVTASQLISVFGCPPLNASQTTLTKKSFTGNNSSPKILWEFRKVDHRIFDAKLSNSRLNNPLEDLISCLISTGISNGRADMAWFWDLYGLQPTENGMIHQYLKSNTKYYSSPLEDRNLLVIIDMSTVEDLSVKTVGKDKLPTKTKSNIKILQKETISSEETNPKASFSQRMKSLEKIFGEDMNWIQYRDETVNAFKQRHQANIFIVCNPSKSNLKQLKDLQNEMACLSMLIPLPPQPIVETTSKKKKKKSSAEEPMMHMDHGKVVTNNYIPTDVSLEILFFSSEYILAASSRDLSTWHEDEEVAKNYRIALQLLPSKQLLAFPSEEGEGKSDSNPNSNSNSKKLKPSKKKVLIEEKSFEKKINDFESIQPSKSIPLIEDPPFGIRLLNVIRFGYKTKKFLLWSQPDATASLTSHDAAHVPGTKEYAKNHSKSAFSSKDLSNGKDGEKLEVKLKCPQSEWLHRNIALRVEGEKESDKMALMPRQSIHIASCHAGKGQLYGCTHGIMEVKTQEEKPPMIVCNKVTFFPPGTRFISFGLSCIDWNGNAFIVTNQNSKDQSSQLYNRPLNNSDLYVCDAVKNILASCGALQVDYDEDLSDALGKLYQNYLGQSTAMDYDDVDDFSVVMEWERNLDQSLSREAKTVPTQGRQYSFSREARTVPTQGRHSFHSNDDLNSRLMDILEQLDDFDEAPLSSLPSASSKQTTSSKKNVTATKKQAVEAKPKAGPKERKERELEKQRRKEKKSQKKK